MGKTAIISIFLIGLLTSSTYGQAKKNKAATKESYKSIQSRSSVNEVSRLLREANDEKIVNPSDALDKVQEALGMSLAQQDAFGEGKSYVLLGEINEGIQEWKLALENYSRAYQKLSTANPGSVEYRRSLQGLGTMNLKLGSFDDALKYFQESLTLNLSSAERSDRILDVSEVYFQMGNYDQALKILDEIPVRKMVDTRVENQRAKIEARKNNFDRSQELYRNSINAVKSSKEVEPQQTQALNDTKENIAQTLNDKKQYDNEISIRQQAVDFNLETKNAAEVAKDKVAIGKAFENKGDNASALKETEEGARIADTINNTKEQTRAYLALAKLYEKNNRTRDALATYRKYSDAVERYDKENEARLIEKSELIKKQKDIEELSSVVSIGQRDETIVSNQRLIIYGLLGVIAIIGTTSFFIYKNARASKIANQLLALKSLRSQMNPHFIFNALNSVNHFIATQDERAANQFLTEFSQLMRLVLENSQEDFIPLQKEQEILSLYLKLEHYRFRDKFDYEIDLDNRINTESLEVPPMLIQPYLENAVWHGLRYKDSKGKLLLRISLQDQNLVAEVIDNGIGRKKSAELKTANQKKHFSMGLKNIGERLSILNKVYKTKYLVSVEDPGEGTGTEVKIYMPLRSRMN
ncbi:hypothetical protein WSM22_20730 [Cytophagales bacterium WSM2-2]|nr:hypothetical protein WSM22_20730 [Cytophagales bacterium WSM2-2]